MSPQTRCNWFPWVFPLMSWLALSGCGIMGQISGNREPGSPAENPADPPGASSDPGNLPVLPPTEPQADCTRQCENKICGPDGCGGTCGQCGSGALCAAGQCAQVPEGVTVDPSTAQRAIFPEIYGLAFASQTTLQELRIPLNRWGGNSTTRYNFELDVQNVAGDYYFENIALKGQGTFGSPGYVSSSDLFVQNNQDASAASLITVPATGWVAKDRKDQHPFTCGFPVSRFGQQTSTDPWDPDCGSGKKQDGTLIPGDPTQTSKQAGPAFVTSWIQHLVQRHGAGDQGGVRFYALDNEINLWNSTHRDVQARSATYDVIWQKTLDYAPAIKSGDPRALVMGYGTWSASDVFNSAKDGEQPYGADRAAHGDKPLMRWYLEQLAEHEKKSGQRLVDCLDVHYYPQGGEPLENTRSLWDPGYSDPSWLNDVIQEPIRLLPRLQEWIDQAYPGTSICISEYNWNLDDQGVPEAALVQADLLGIFGKHGVRLASFWTTPVDDQGKPRPAYYAFALFRNYDGNGGAFGEIAVQAASTFPDLAAYAARRKADNAITVVLINKAAVARTVGLTVLQQTGAGSASLFRYVAAAGATLKREPDLTVTDGKVPLSLPAHSMAIPILPN